MHAFVATRLSALHHIVRGSSLTLLTVLLLCLALQPQAARAATMELQVQPDTGLPVVMLGGVPVASVGYVYWGKNWAWASQTQKAERLARLSYRTTGNVAALGLALEAQVQPGVQAANQPERLALSWRYQGAADLPDVIGGGLAVRFNLRAAQPLLGEPELLPDGLGFAWGKTGAGRVELRFAAKPAALYFERGQKGELRVMFHSGAIKAGALDARAELSASLGARITPHLRERLPAPDASWKPAALPFDQLGLPDLSYLNAADKPAGKRGFVKAVGEQLQFPDGSQARFWGTNLSAYSLFSTPRYEVPKQAQRLAAQGYNLVRLHHHDSTWVNPNIFGRNAGKSGDIDETQANKIDWWIKCLADEGIYTWLDLHVGRHFGAGDNIDAFAELTKGKPTGEGKGYNYVNPSIQEAMKRFAERYLTRVSTETGRRAIDDPAVAFVALTNENDVTHHFGNALLPDKKVPWHNAGYMAAAKQFAEKHGLDRDKTWRSWEAGPSKVFLNDLERRFADDQIRHLKALGLKALVSTTSTWGDNPIYSLPALTVGDVVDVHAYGGEGWMGIDPLVAPNLLHWIHAGKVAGKPSTVTEWNLDGGLHADRATLPIYLAASAAHQGVAALMHYAYTQGPFNLQATGPYEAHADPLMAYVMPLAALTYRRGLVAPARQSVVYTPKAEDFFGQSQTPANPALRTHSETSRFSVGLPGHPALPWLTPYKPAAGQRTITQAANVGLPASSTLVRSDTGELVRDWSRRLTTIDTRRLQAAMGELAGNDIKLADVQLSLLNALGTAVAVSLDDQPLAQSADWVLMVAARAQPGSTGKAPYLLEPVGGVVRFRLEQPMQVNIVSSDGLGAQALFTPQPANQGWLALDLGDFKGKGALVLRFRKPTTRVSSPS